MICGNLGTTCKMTMIRITQGPSCQLCTNNTSVPMSYVSLGTTCNIIVIRNTQGPRTYYYQLCTNNTSVPMTQVSLGTISVYMQTDSDLNHPKTNLYYYYLGTNNTSVPMTCGNLGTTCKMTIIIIIKNKNQQPITIKVLFWL